VSRLDTSPSPQGPADRHPRDFATAQGLRQVGGWDPESAMPPNRSLPHPASALIHKDGALPFGARATSTAGPADRFVLDADWAGKSAGGSGGAATGLGATA
jgi:hypothetical protein